MPIDPSIILGIQQPKLDNPLDMAQKAMTMQQMGYQNQMQQRQMGDDQAMREAYQKNMTVGPDGAPTINRQGLVTDLMQRNPMLAASKGQELGAQDLQARDQKMKALNDQVQMGKTLFNQVRTGSGVSPDITQSDWTDMLAQRSKLGLSNDHLTSEFPGEAGFRSLEAQGLSIEEKLAQHNKDREFDQKKEEHQLTRQQMGMNKQNQALQQTQSILESAKGNPAVAQAQKDIYAADKFGSLVNLYGDANKLNPAQVQLAATEVAKIASGGVPSIHELQGLNPSTLPSGLASLAERVINRPQSAEAGEFVKRMQDYTNALKADAQKVVAEKFGRVIETRKDSLGDKHYSDLKAQYLDPLMKERAQGKGGGQTPVLKTHEIEWAE